MESKSPPRRVFKLLSRKEKQPLFDLFEINNYPDEEVTDELANDMNLSPRKVRKWFADRRGDLKRRRQAIDEVEEVKAVKQVPGSGSKNGKRASSSSKPVTTQDLGAAKFKARLRTKEEVEVLASGSKNSKGASSSSKPVSATGPVTEDEVRAVLLHKAPVTTQDLGAAKFKARLRTKEEVEVPASGSKNSKGASSSSKPVSERVTSILDLQQKQLEELKASCNLIKLELQEARLTWDQELKKIAHHAKGLEVASSSYHKVFEDNRKLYNQIQDLKGAVRVFCRVKPLHDEQSTVDRIGENGNIVIVHRDKQGKDSRKTFSFNKVFGGNTTQEQIYVDTQPLIRSVLDGYNVCIFAYGQTGSGKTYTMSGPDIATEDTWGVNYRALRDLFQLSEARKGFIRYEVGVQIMEIYNEQVRDLLVTDGSNRRLDIRNNSQLNGLNVPDASLESVKCTQDVFDLMRTGKRNRAVGATALNERSSRSHSITTVHIRGKEIVSGSTLKGCLHLVDLAGSERTDKSEVVGECLKEAQLINKSLSVLGDVIYALAEKSSHVPYRSSKLTQLLQDSLGGNAKALMFVHINAEINAIEETISTLKFVERVQWRT